MRQLYLSLIIFCCTFTIYAQNDPTTFLGIPVDGNKEEVIQQLYAKGFVVNPQTPEFLMGEFNGTQVNVGVATNKNKVWRIMVIDSEPTDERNIKLRFNRLCKQFESNDRYLSPVPHGSYSISEDEDISYEMNMRNKQYTATYNQKLTISLDTVNLTHRIREMVASNFQDKIDTVTDELVDEVFKNIVFDIIDKKQVWFTIMQFNNDYLIAMFYDNLNNQANGEDL